MTASKPFVIAGMANVPRPTQAGLSPSLAFASWQRLWAELGASSAPRGEHERLLDGYREKDRAYHTLQHLAECLEIRQRLAAGCDKPAEIDIALWFHDAIYAPKRSDNEARSADWLERVAGACGLGETLCRRLHRLVMVTQHDAAPQTRDEAVLVDTDLAILGAATVRFDAYDAQVREEYRFVPRCLYRRKRRQVLEGFFARPRIYLTDEYFEVFEAQARRNLKTAIASLS